MNALTQELATTPRQEAEAFVRCQVVIHRVSEPVFSHTSAVLFILVWIALNLVYLLFLCPFDLAPDEAHYWQWSQRLDWSYYSKGPLVAWLIRGSCELFGSCPEALRLPAVLSSAALLAGLYMLLVDILRNRRFALMSIVCISTIPAISAGAVIMTIDPPFLACWCWALVSVNRAVQTSGCRWWLVAGFCTALGVLAKYPMLLLPAAVMVYTVVSRRGEFRRPGIWCFLFLTALGVAPILFWNANNDWVSFHHVIEQAGMGEESDVSWLNPLAYLGGQAGLLLGFWFAAVAAGAWRFRGSPTREAIGSNPPEPHYDTGLSLMWWASVPVWLFFFVASFATPGQANWPAAAYVGGAVLGAAWIREKMAGRFKPALRVGMILAIILGIVLSVGIRFPQLARPLLARLVKLPSENNPTPLRKLDPTCRLQGWTTLAVEIDGLRDRIRRDTGEEPVLAGMTWTIPGELSFYCVAHPPAYSFGSALADRHSQFDLWRPNPVNNPAAFRGRTFLYVGDEIPDAHRVFDRLDPPIRVVHREGAIPVASWTIWICHGFKGFPPRRTQPSF
jgi:hypothetical protein